VDAVRRTDAADQPGPEVAYQVAVEVAHDQYIELLRFAHQLHAAVVHDDFLRLQVREVLRRRPERLQEQAVRQLEDIRLVHAVDRAPAGRPGPLERKAEEPPTGRLGHDLDALHDTGNDLVLDGGVQVLGDFADDEQINVLKT